MFKFVQLSCWSRPPGFAEAKDAQHSFFANLLRQRDAEEGQPRNTGAGAERARKHAVDSHGEGLRQGDGDPLTGPPGVLGGGLPISLIKCGRYRGGASPHK